MRLKKFNIEYGKTIFKSFSDVSRIRILNILANRKEASISDLEMILNFTQTKTSRHIYYLKNSGLLNSENKDQFIFYSLREEALDIIDQIFEFLSEGVMIFVILWFITIKKRRRYLVFGLFMFLYGIYSIF